MKSICKHIPNTYETNGHKWISIIPTRGKGIDYSVSIYTKYIILFYILI